ncbi:hypothetical protein CC80DRAFT_544917 [Byssothecium circinans]|uniref:Zn(2)-C6 fungal-type domain-containing protein n=1 Tax=Byssothecium circinans TaxID=147558 RepID=A0A6A5U807_9PLEO|nr:hypothetical protein CC80DRAFT_544917 [Byssothecium circinans]
MSAEPQTQQRYIPPSRRRDKPILSCTLCRRRKLKCDRQQPCKACVDRGLSLSCTYARNQHVATPPSDPKAPHNVHDRIDQLEKLVTTLMEQKRNAASFSPATIATSMPAYSPKPDDGTVDADVPSAPDRVRLENDETSYTNGGHWTSILDGIAELKGELDKIQITPQPSTADEEVPGPDLLFGHHRHASREEILLALPPKADADQLIVKYFNVMDMAVVILHRPTFLREYEKFWENPGGTPIMWIGLLYGIFTVATHFNSLQNKYHHAITTQSQMTLSTPRIDFYREKIVQCLILANYPKCPPYTLETLSSYFVVEYLRSQDSQAASWLLTGLVVRTAFRMGYHREPSRFANISPFKAEMRRRMWTMIVHLDLMSSVQVGLPMMIQPSIPDVKDPRNLSDSDLDENMTELPPPRPETESTAMLYVVSRNRLLRIFARIQERANESEQPGYRESLELDAAIRSTYESLPESFKGYEAKEFDVKSEVATRKLFTALTYLKCLLMIHRPFLLLGREDSRFEYSRAACLDAALEILDFQSLLEVESRTGFEGWSHTWKLWMSTWRLSAPVNHDFLFATTVILLDLNKDLVSPLPESNSTIPRQRWHSGQPTRSELIAALGSSYNVWQLASAKSREAAKVAAAVKLVLGKTDSSDMQSRSTPVTPAEHDGPSFLATQQRQEPDVPMDSCEPTSFFDFNNLETSLPYSMNDVAMDFGGTFDWGGLESQYPLPSFEKNLQNSYFS